MGVFGVLDLPLNVQQRGFLLLRTFLILLSAFQKWIGALNWAGTLPLFVSFLVFTSRLRLRSAVSRDLAAYTTTPQLCGQDCRSTVVPHLTACWYSALKVHSATHYIWCLILTVDYWYGFAPFWILENKSAEPLTLTHSLITHNISAVAGKFLRCKMVMKW